MCNSAYDNILYMRCKTLAIETSEKETRLGNKAVISGGLKGLFFYFLTKQV